MLSSVDWHALIAPEMSPLEIFARGTLVYLGLFVMMRVVLKRQSGALGITDLLVVVLIADAAQNAMAGDYRSVPDGLLLVATILFWCYTLDWLGYRFPAIERLLSPSPLPIVRDGQILRANLRRELITLDELRSFLREQGVDEITDVKEAHVEPDGRISVVRRSLGDETPPEPKRRPAG